VIEQLRGFRRQGQQAQLVPLAAHRKLPFGEQHIITVQGHHFGGAEPLHQHQADDGQVASVSKTGPEARHFIDRQRNDVEPGLPYSESAESEPGASQAHRPAVQEGLMEAVRDLTGSIGELIADSMIGSGGAVVDGGGRRRRSTARLEAHVIEQSRLGEVRGGDFARVMDALPPAHEVQQAVRVAVEGLVCETADILAVEVPIDPRDAFAGGLLYHLNRTMCTRRSLLADDAELHGCAASSKDWNWCGSPPWTKKELGSCPSGSRTRRAEIPCTTRR